MPISDLRLFIDEVGNSDLKGASTDPNVRYLSLTGILTTQSHHDTALTALLESVKTCLPNHSDRNPVILHRREAMRREGPFAALRDRTIANAFDVRLMEAIEKAPYRAITVQIDKKEHLDTYGAWHFDPYHYCLRCLVERFILYARRHGARGLVAIEPRYKKSDKKLKASFERIYQSGTDVIPARIVQDHLQSKDIVFYPKSANVAGLQLADVIAHPSARSMRLDRDGLAAPCDFGSRVAEILKRERYSRSPKTKKVDGWGTKWLP